ncbi:UTRA domain-containing protein [Streptomyces rubiginosohelvolus]|uniref:UTRA domain-containing protein n=1 Tax=Streptomyces rubiginosohelvolus TaxID=67362 RepID=UPI0037AE47C5
MTEGQWSGSSTPYLGADQGDVWGKEAAAKGKLGTQRLLGVGRQIPNGDIARHLQVQAGGEVVERQRLILLDEEPVEIATSYWPVILAGDTPLARPAKIRGGAVSLLASLGYTPGSIDEEIATRPPTGSEAEALGLTAGEWVLILTRIIRAATGEPYEVSVMVSPGRIGRLHYSMKVG